MVNNRWIYRKTLGITGKGAAIHLTMHYFLTEYTYHQKQNTNITVGLGIIDKSEIALQ